jgi:hypothetical protein
VKQLLSSSPKRQAVRLLQIRKLAGNKNG